MNKDRRKDIESIKERIESLRNELDSIAKDIEVVKDEEQEYLDNFPANMENSDRAQSAAEALNNLDYAYSELSDIDIDGIVTYLTDAQA